MRPTIPEVVREREHDTGVMEGDPSCRSDRSDHFLLERAGQWPGESTRIPPKARSASETASTEWFTGPRGPQLPVDLSEAGRRLLQVSVEIPLCGARGRCRWPPARAWGTLPPPERHLWRAPGPTVVRTNKRGISRPNELGSVRIGVDYRDWKVLHDGNRDTEAGESETVESD